LFQPAFHRHYRYCSLPPHLMISLVGSLASRVARLVASWANSRCVCAYEWELKLGNKTLLLPPGSPFLSFLVSSTPTPTTTHPNPPSPFFLPPPPPPPSTPTQLQLALTHKETKNSRKIKYQSLSTRHSRIRLINTIMSLGSLVRRLENLDEQANFTTPAPSIPPICHCRLRSQPRPHTCPAWSLPAGCCRCGVRSAAVGVRALPEELRAVGFGHSQGNQGPRRAAEPGN
jgi:hypothetical protein